MEEINSEEVWYTHTLSTWKRTIIDVKEIMSVLKYRDIRSVLNWCKKHNVFVLNQGNTQAVNQVEFILAFYKPFLKHLKRTKQNWKELFVDYVCGNVTNALDEEEEKKVKKNVFPSYTQRSAVETTFLEKMKEI